MKQRIWNAIEKEIALWRLGALPGLLVIGLVVLLRLTGSLQQAEWWALDHLLRARPEEPIDDRILIVGIDEADIRQVGVYPIPDQKISALIETLETYDPATIGIDLVRDIPIPPGQEQLAQTFRTHDNVIAIEKVLPDDSGNTIGSMPGLTEAQVGFADVVLDQDSALRRSLLATPTEAGDYKFSLALRLAEIYLADRGCGLANGIRDSAALRFCSVELTRFRANAGGYVRADDRGNQILLNYRTGEQPFRVVSMTEVLQGNVETDWIRDRIVLIGVTATTGRDMVKSAAVDRSISGLIYGIESHAHVISQIVSAVLDQRPLLRVWTEGWEYLWIITWGVIGILFGRIFSSPAQTLLGLGIATAGLMGLCYVAMIAGWWLPLVPTLLVLNLNSVGLTAALFYRHQQSLQARIQDRQLVIDQTFDAIHNGPLQTLAHLLRKTQDSTPVEMFRSDLEQLNRELRSVYESVRQETLPQHETLYLCHDTQLNLQYATHELLHEVYRTTLTRGFPEFKTIKVKVVSFENIDQRPFSLETKRGLCRFLEEALCNAGKYAIGMTRLEVTCKTENGKILIRVADNGTGKHLPFNQQGGQGTQQAKKLARQLGGQFHRSPHSPQGTICELTFPVRKFWFS